MNAPLPPTLTTHLVSIVADADSGLLARIGGVLARLDILPVQIYSRLRSGMEEDGARDAGKRIEIDLYLSSEAAGRKDRLLALLRVMVGVESVAASA